MSNNPYAPPADQSVMGSPLSDVESVRQAHINHEASLKSIGTLYILGAIILVPMGLVLIVLAFPKANPQVEPAESVIIAGVGMAYLVIGLLQCAIAVGLWKLQTWARWTAVVLSAIGLLAIPLGTIIAGYFLYLLLSQKGTVVFSDQYKQIIAATPHIKYKTSKILVLLLLLLLLVIMVVAAMTSM